MVEELVTEKYVVSDEERRLADETLNPADNQPKHDYVVEKSARVARRPSIEARRLGFKVMPDGTVKGVQDRWEKDQRKGHFKETGTDLRPQIQEAIQRKELQGYVGIIFKDKVNSPSPSIPHSNGKVAVETTPLVVFRYGLDENGAVTRYPSFRVTLSDHPQSVNLKLPTNGATPNSHGDIVLAEALR